MKPEEYVARLIEILEKKKSLFHELLSLTEKQTEVICEDKLEELQRLVDEKQIKIDAAVKLDDDFQVYFRRLKSELRLDSLDELRASQVEGAARLKDLTAVIIGLAEKISFLEKANNTSAKSLLNKLGGEVRKVSEGRRINSAYTPGPVSAPSYFIDKKK